MERFIFLLKRDWFFGLFLIVAVFVVYQPVWSAGFIWDDDAHLTANPCVVGPLGLKEIWTTSQSQYYPLVLTTFWMEHKLWGLVPLPYHLVNVLIHGVCGVILWRVLRALGVRGAWMGAAIWALHPVEVETVAWITELKNTQSCFFYLLSILFFVRWLKVGRTDGVKGRGRNYVLSLLFATLAMASKSSTVVLPLVFCLVAWWVEGGWRWRILLRIAPVFLMSAIAALLALWTVDLQGVNADKEWLRSWPERLITAGNVFWFYLFKLAWPYPLTFIYPRWGIDARQALSYLPLLAAMVVMFTAWWQRNRWARPGFLGLTYFLLALLPVLGLIEHFFLRYSFVADHLQYLASIGPLALVGAGLGRMVEGVPGRVSPCLVLCAGVLLVLGVMSWTRAWAFQSQETLWTDTLSKNSDCWLAYNNLGGLVLEQGKVNEAIADYEKTLAINPKLYETAFNLGNAFFQARRMDEAINQYRHTLKLKPDYAAAEVNLGVTLFESGRFDEAIDSYRRALALDPAMAKAHFNLGNAFSGKGREDEAIVEYQSAIGINPGYIKARDMLGRVLLKRGDSEGAMAQFGAVIKLQPNFVLPYYDLGNSFLQKRQPGPAILMYLKALEVDPNSPKTHNNLGAAFAQAGRREEGRAQFEEALRLQPGYDDARENLEKLEAKAPKTAPAGK